MEEKIATVLSQKLFLIFFNIHFIPYLIQASGLAFLF